MLGATHSQAAVNTSMGDRPHVLELNDRAQHLFKLLVERYIADGHPVGSRTLARDAKLELSSATIRNVMADLEDLGLIRAPHTSAGRIPTVRGYRLFVDSILTWREPTQFEMSSFANDLKRENDVRRLLERTSTMLSGPPAVQKEQVSGTDDSKKWRWLVPGSSGIMKP